jgi:hypothetical protein
MRRQLNQVDVNEEQPQHKRIAWWIENTLIRWAKRLFNAIGDNVRQLINYGIDDVLEDTEDGIRKVAMPYINHYIDDPSVPPEIRNMLQEMVNADDQGALIPLVGILISIISGGQSGWIAPTIRKIEYEADAQKRSYLFDPATISAMLQRNIIDDNQYNEMMALNGVPNDGIRWLREFARPLFNQSELANLMWRNKLSEGDVKAELEHYGYNAAQQQFLVDLMEVIPSPNELISMAVREAFNDQVSAQFGYDEGYPEEAADIAAKSGYPERFFRYAWRAHWDLPGLVQVREMWQRNIITDDDLTTYLKAADLPVFWRSAITDWMHTEVTRVDIRRIFSLGLISPDEMYERYIRLGYRPDDAELMTEWTVANYLDEERTLTKSDTLRMYKDGILTYDEASSFLRALDYRDDAIALYLAHQDLLRQQDIESRIIGNVEDLYIAGIYDRTDVFDQLGKLDTPAEFIEQSLMVWDVERDKKTSKPTTTQLRDFAQTGIITWDMFRDEMRFRGYPDKYIDWYIELYQSEE